jgi:Zn ribbon nucleic-acid-binding protein
MTEDIFTGILEAYRKDEISIGKTKRQIRLLLDPKSTSEVVKKNDLSHFVIVSVCPECNSTKISVVGENELECDECCYSWQTEL